MHWGLRCEPPRLCARARRRGPVEGADKVSLQKRLLLFVLICAPVVWGVAAWFSVDRAREETDELFDTEIIRLARQVQATLGGLAQPDQALPPPPGPTGEADLRDLAIAVWDGAGRVLLRDREGAQIPYRADAVGFVSLTVHGEPWRVYYLQSPLGSWLVAAGQNLNERDELVWGLLGAQLVPWLLVLPVLLLAMAWRTAQAMAPVRALTTELQARAADNLQPVQLAQAPTELRPLLAAMNGLFGRTAATLERERRFTADAAHELRTPLAVLRAQWDLLQQAPDEAARLQAVQQLDRGLGRMDRLVAQLLALSRLDATDRVQQPQPVAWSPIVEEVLSDVLALADRRQIELAVEGDPGRFVWQGDAALLTMLLRNLVDNAVRYAPAGTTVLLRFEAQALCVENGGPALAPETLARLGQRFWRREGQGENGSGLGVSIAQRIATLHGLSVHYSAAATGPGSDLGSRAGQGVVARLAPA
jgi:two-component system, OmpR family, sensor histidine kinase QseC